MKQLLPSFPRCLFSLMLSVTFLPGFIAHAGPANAQSIFIEGYAGQQSVAPGEDLSLHISTSVEKYDVEISRIGAQNKSVWARNKVPGQAYPIPENASSHGTQWPESFSITIPQEWQSGYYQVTLRAKDNGGKFTGRGRRTAESTCYFIIRSATPGKNTKILLQLATNTYNAYNNWGGFSLYAYHGRSGIQGHRVSFDRPPASQFGNWELPFVRWAESNGYEIDYAANSDLEFRPELLQHYNLILSVGHDEYWSAPMRDHLEAYIAKGGNVAFFSGNTICWQVRSEDQGRALTSWKQNYHSDPVYATGDHTLLTSLWSHHLVNRPENQLTGVGFLYGGYHLSHGQVMDGTGAYTVHRPDHWIFKGTKLKRDDAFGSKNTIVGYECDGCEIQWRDGIPYPTHKDGTPKTFLILGTAPAKWAPDDSEWYEKWENGRTGNAVLGLYTKPNGGTVFTSGSTDWAHGLRGGDPEVEQITKNILDRLAK